MELQKLDNFPDNPYCSPFCHGICNSILFPIVMVYGQITQSSYQLPAFINDGIIQQVTLIEHVNNLFQITVDLHGNKVMLKNQFESFHKCKEFHKVVSAINEAFQEPKDLVPSIVSHHSPNITLTWISHARSISVAFVVVILGRGPSNNYSISRMRVNVVTELEEFHNFSIGFLEGRMGSRVIEDIVFPSPPNTP